ncbi:MAG: calcium-binding EGF-like domain-containing protein [Saprospiraceae bacterium]
MKNSLFLFLLVLLLFFQTCKKDDPCSKLTCKNGGECIDGTCSCPTGYSGPDCSTLLIPKSAKIRFLTIRNWPTVNSFGVSWDSLAYPDLFYRICVQGSSKVEYESTIEPDMRITGPISFQLNYEILSPQSTYQIKLYDSDFPDEDDLIATGNFKAWDGSTFPDKIIVHDGITTFEIDLSYNF